MKCCDFCERRFGRRFGIRGHDLANLEEVFDQRRNGLPDAMTPPQIELTSLTRRLVYQEQFPYFWLQLYEMPQDPAGTQNR